MLINVNLTFTRCLLYFETLTLDIIQTLTLLVANNFQCVEIATSQNGFYFYIKTLETRLLSKLLA